MKFCPKCGYHFTSETEKFCPSCGYDINKVVVAATDRDRNSIKIEKTGGDVFGVGVSGSGHTIGKNIVVGSGTINVSETELQKIPNEYAQALKDFSESINRQLKGKQIPEEEVKSINNNMNELAKEVEDIKQPGKEGEQQEAEIDYVKQTQIETKTASLIQRVLQVLPEAAETAATFTPLAPFSKLIGKGTQQIVNAITKGKRS
jgi:soluble cytochrome b562